MILSHFLDYLLIPKLTNFVKLWAGEKVDVEKNLLKNECTIREVIPPGSKKDCDDSDSQSGDDARANHIAPKGMN
jgi:hypothetical protein